MARARPIRQRPVLDFEKRRARGTGGRVDVVERREWPMYLVFFEQLEPTLMAVLGPPTGEGYRECWRGFNSRWHDDWRRKGDVIIWCLE